MLTIRIGQSHLWLLVCKNTSLHNKLFNLLYTETYIIEYWLLYPCPSTSEQQQTTSASAKASAKASSCIIMHHHAASCSIMIYQEVFSANKRQSHARKAICNVTRKLFTEFQASAAFACYDSPSICAGSVSMTEHSHNHWL